MLEDKIKEYLVKDTANAFPEVCARQAHDIAEIVNDTIDSAEDEIREEMEIHLQISHRASMERTKYYLNIIKAKVGKDVNKI